MSLSKIKEYVVCPKTKHDVVVSKCVYVVYHIILVPQNMFVSVLTDDFQLPGSTGHFVCRYS